MHVPKNLQNQLYTGIQTIFTVLTRNTSVILAVDSSLVGVCFLQEARNGERAAPSARATRGVRHARAVTSLHERTPRTPTTRTTRMATWDTAPTTVATTTRTGRAMTSTDNTTTGTDDVTTGMGDIMMNTRITTAREALQDTGAPTKTKREANARRLLLSAADNAISRAVCQRQRSRQARVTRSCVQGICL